MVESLRSIAHQESPRISGPEKVAAMTHSQSDTDTVSQHLHRIVYRERALSSQFQEEEEEKRKRRRKRRYIITYKIFVEYYLMITQIQVKETKRQKDKIDFSCTAAGRQADKCVQEDGVPGIIVVFF